MNINTNNKYNKMHIDVLSVCEQHDIKAIPGARISYEILHSAEVAGLKELLVTPEDMSKFVNKAISVLKDRGYLVEEDKHKGDKVCRIYGTDMLATTVHALMSKPSGKHYPQIIIRQMTENEGQFRCTSSDKELVFDCTALTGLQKISYKDSYVYVCGSIENHIETVLGKVFSESNPASGYAVFSETCTAEELVREAKKRGLLSMDRTLKYKKYRLWKKEKRGSVEEKYRQYQEVLLGLKKM